MGLLLNKRDALQFNHFSEIFSLRWGQCQGPVLKHCSLMLVL